MNKKEREFIKKTRVITKRMAVDLGIPKPMLSNATIGYREVDVSTEEGKRIIKDAELLEVSVEYPSKTGGQKAIDASCGCECHKPDHNTQNYMWCGNCHEKHKNDNRYGV